MTATSPALLEVTDSTVRLFGETIDDIQPTSPIQPDGETEISWSDSLFSLITEPLSQGQLVVVKVDHHLALTMLAEGFFPAEVFEGAVLYDQHVRLDLVLEEEDYQAVFALLIQQAETTEVSNTHTLIIFTEEVDAEVQGSLGEDGLFELLLDELVAEVLDPESVFDSYNENGEDVS